MIFATILSNVMKGKSVSLEGFEQDVEDDTNEPSNYIDSSKGNTVKVFGEETDEKKAMKAKVKADKNTKEPTPSFSGNASPTPTKLMENLREQALDLQDAQKSIINGFQQIEPHMDRAESLIASIQNTADSIKSLKNSQ